MTKAINNRCDQAERKTASLFNRLDQKLGKAIVQFNQGHPDMLYGNGAPMLADYLRAEKERLQECRSAIDGGTPFHPKPQTIYQDGQILIGDKAAEAFHGACKAIRKARERGMFISGLPPVASEFLKSAEYWSSHFAKSIKNGKGQQ